MMGRQLGDWAVVIVKSQELEVLGPRVGVVAIGTQLNQLEDLGSKVGVVAMIGFAIRLARVVNHGAGRRRASQCLEAGDNGSATSMATSRARRAVVLMLTMVEAEQKAEGVV